MDFRNEKAKKLKQGAIRAMFDRAATMTDVISMGIGEPDMPTPELVCRAGAEALQQGLTHYTPNAGTMQLRRAIAERASVAPVGYDPAQEIIITNGGMGALSLLFLVILNDGDEILIQDPQWLNYVAQVQYCGGVPVRVPTKAEDRFAMQPDVIESLITPRTKAIMVNSPNNPTGEVYSDEQLAAIAAIAEKHDLLVISDEVYNTLLYTGAKFRSIAELPGMKARTVVVNSFSKSYAMTGWRIGYALGNKAFISAMTKIHQYTMLCAPITAQIAAIEALRHGEKYMKKMVAEYDRRRHLIYDGFTKMGRKRLCQFLLIAGLEEFGFGNYLAALQVEVQGSFHSRAMCASLVEILFVSVRSDVLVRFCKIACLVAFPVEFA